MISILLPISLLFFIGPALDIFGGRVSVHGETQPEPTSQLGGNGRGWELGGMRRMGPLTLPVIIYKGRRGTEGKELEKTRRDVNPLRKQPQARCRDFEHVSGSFSLDGEVLRKVSDELTAAECKSSCLAANDFICTAAQLQLPASCYLQGYQLRSSPDASHFLRVCEHGPSCFKELPGFSSFSSGGGQSIISVTVPRQYTPSRELSSMYCMVHCEVMTSQYCIGFDMKYSGVGSNQQQQHGGPVCYFSKFNAINGPNFDLYIRKC